VDGSFFCSNAAVNPALTIMADALRVGDHLMKTLDARTSDIEKQGCTKSGDFVL